ncbi:ArsR/SmtB family transcription factor [Asticcacaulis machinosus]|uniref:Metalloregulator ArsR/SmtB family transcription factor n=1 Tax=Asticcacaulis machinosus TaxID=2984211 RepID=A0ABT5HG54_9CAUL|nr:metalloregulator ArsR/SmtB family transcription factor [Asticcacaulis machinosus]MDC7675239.1 metalloregulator ArsR/SmtB family transcription factor [Asticcacaulis machinosus]
MPTPDTPADVLERNAAEAEAMLKLLANRHRLLILCQLIDQRKSVGEINENIKLSQSALSQHLAKMRAQGLIEAEKQGQMVYYRLANPKVTALLSTLYLIYCQA